MATVNWTNDAKQIMPVHYPSDKEDKTIGLKPKNVEAAVDFAKRAYSNKALPKDTFVALTKNTDKTIRADVVQPTRHDVYVSETTDEEKGLYSVVRQIGPSLPRLQLLA